MIDIIAWANELGITPPWTVLALFFIIVFGVGRLARLITYDAFPPSVAFRNRWAEITNNGPWEKLFSCYWCLTPWITLVALVWFVLAWDVEWAAIAWVAFWGWLAIAYLTSMVVNRDERD